MKIDLGLIPDIPFNNCRDYLKAVPSRLFRTAGNPACIKKSFHLDYTQSIGFAEINLEIDSGAKTPGSSDSRSAELRLSVIVFQKHHRRCFYVYKSLFPRTSHLAPGTTHHAPRTFFARLKISLWVSNLFDGVKEGDDKRHAYRRIYSPFCVLCVFPGNKSDFPQLTARFFNLSTKFSTTCNLFRQAIHPVFRSDAPTQKKGMNNKCL